MSEIPNAQDPRTPGGASSAPGAAPEPVRATAPPAPPTGSAAKVKTDDEDDEPNLKGLYGAVQSAIWLIGLAILFYTGNWFPGILILVAISGVTQWVLAGMASRAEQKAADEAATAAAARKAAAAVPPNCPTCGAAISAATVTWTGATAAHCPYCKAAIKLAV